MLALDQQEDAAAQFESTAVQATADLIDFVLADSFEAVAREAA
jgi:hypothetical protein